MVLTYFPMTSRGHCTQNPLNSDCTLISSGYGWGAATGDLTAQSLFDDRTQAAIN